MTGFQAKDLNYEARVRGSFRRQRIMEAIGAVLTRVAPGEVEIELPFRDDLTQQHGYVHGGMVTAIADSACGYAVLSLLPADAEVLTVEYKVNFLAPAQGQRLVARGRVVRLGETVSVCAGDVFTAKDSAVTAVATMLTTMIARAASLSPAKLPHDRV